MNELTPRYLDTRQAATYVGLSPTTLHRMRGTGGGPPYARWGRRVIYDRADLDEWMARCKGGRPPEDTDDSDSTGESEETEEPGETEE